MFLDFLKRKYDFPEFKEEKKFKALILNNSIPQTEEKVFFVKPTTFMNLS
jgi:peptidyl-tRNA hydrolase